MPGIFDSKYFNAEVFQKYTETVPRVKQNEFLKNGILRNRAELKTALSGNVGGNVITVPMTGLLTGTAQNYDGGTDITPNTGLGTYLQTMIVVGRAAAWTEKDFAYDISSKDWMAEIAKQTVNYWDDVDQATILAILSGIFGVTADSFNTKHTFDITAATNANVDATTLNNAIQQASGANKSIFKMAIMHSQIATNLENLQLLEYRKYTDANGIQRDMAIADWNGRTVLIDDEVPTEDDKYTTYLLGEGAFDYCDVGAKVPVETHRDPKTNGGEDTLFNRQRKIFAPRGFSFVQPSTAIISPTDTQLATAARWTIVKDSTDSKYFNSKAIPIARIISKG